MSGLPVTGASPERMPLSFVVPAGSTPVFTDVDGALLDVPGSALQQRSIVLAV